jgi:hypothetical protein
MVHAGAALAICPQRHNTIRTHTQKLNTLHGCMPSSFLRPGLEYDHRRLKRRMNDQVLRVFNGYYK